MRNRDRANVAEEQLTAFAVKMGLEGDELETQMSDMLCYMRHLAEREDIDFMDLLDRSHRAFESDNDAEEQDGTEQLFSDDFTAEEIIQKVKDSKVIRAEFIRRAEEDPEMDWCMGDLKEILEQVLSMDINLDDTNKCLSILDFFNAQQKETVEACKPF